MTEKQAKKKKIPRQPMPEQTPEVRRRNFDEVPTGYSAETAMEEAQRCLQCKKPSCVGGCPVQVDIPGFVKQIADGKFSEAIQTIWGRNSLPAICGRVCPQE
ncbi:MAG: dihydropyrimidine dehydrogenase, partial [Desulfosalsimonas sp.]